MRLLVVLWCAVLITSIAAQNQPTYLKSSRLNLKRSALLSLPATDAAASNCRTFADSLSILAVGCNGVSVSPVVFDATNRTVVSGTTNTVGVVYRYPGATTTPGGTVLDALVTVVSSTNNQDATPNTVTETDIQGGVGVVDNLQPNLNQGGTLTGGIPWNGSITYQIQFVTSGGTYPANARVITLAATSIDNDGSAKCGGLKERVTYSSGFNQILFNATPNNQTNLGGGTVESTSNTSQAGIGLAPEWASSALYLNVSQITWTQGFTTGNCTAGEATEVRYGSLNLTCLVDFTPDFATIPLSGTVFNDINGLSDSTVNGTGTNAGGLFANLVDANGNVLSSVPVAADGTYSFNVPANAGNYTVRISTTQGIESNAAPANTLPAGWVSTGENLGAGAGNDGSVNATLPVTIGAVAITNANFAIEQRPTANNGTAASQANPGGTVSAAIPATVFTATDPAGGTVASIRITAFPSNATSITINGTLYTSATFPVGGVTVPTNAAGNPTQPILVDPIDGAVTVGILYVAIDNVGVESAAAATASIPFGGASISGSVFNDLNGLTDSTVNGAVTNAGGPLFANLLNSSNVVVQTVAIPAGGTYNFAGVGVGSYTVQISTNQGVVGNAAPATALPAGWANTGENIGTAAGNDGTPNGLLPVTIASQPVANANFGIEQRPTANNGTALTQINPGGTTNLTVPAGTFTASDPGGGTVTSIRITAFPTGGATSITINGTLYTSATFPVGGVVVPANTSGNPTQTIQVDPLNGGRTIVIPYVAIDNAGIESSTPATASLPVLAGATAGEVSITGRVLDDQGRGAGRSIVTVVGQDGVEHIRMTNPFGYFRVKGLNVNQLYVVQVTHKRFTYDSRSVSLTEDLANVDFVPQQQPQP